MQVVTFNANGIRSAQRKGFFEWLGTQDIDIVCIQETKAQEHQLDDDLFYPEGFHCYYYDAEKKGYSGTAIYSRVKPTKVTRGLGFDPVDDEGRWIRADYPGLSVISFYLPSGSSGEERQARKIALMDRMLPELKALRRKRREFIICGDWNICHREIDLKNWKPNSKNSGFLPEERAWLDHLFDDLGYIDAFRLVNQEAEQYTWWSNRGQARQKNVGWRLDYHLVTPGLRETVQSTFIYTDEKFSDHAPTGIEYDWQL